MITSILEAKNLEFCSVEVPDWSPSLLKRTLSLSDSRAWMLSNMPLKCFIPGYTLTAGGKGGKSYGTWEMECQVTSRESSFRTIYAYPRN